MKEKSEIPYFFNAFIHEEMRKDNCDYDKICWTFSKLAVWMKEKNLTDLMVEYVGFQKQK